MNPIKKFLERNSEFISEYMVIQTSNHYALFFVSDYGDIDYNSYYDSGGNPIYSPVELPFSDFMILREEF